MTVEEKNLFSLYFPTLALQSKIRYVLINYVPCYFVEITDITRSLHGRSGWCHGCFLS
jgi:hypothetical protein